MSDGCVYRTAPATPGLLKSTNRYFLEKSKRYKSKYSIKPPLSKQNGVFYSNNEVYYYFTFSNKLKSSFPLTSDAILCNFQILTFKTLKGLFQIKDDG